MALALLPPLLLLLLVTPGDPRGDPRPEQLQVLTVATEATEGYKRFLRSAQAFNYSVTTLGLGQPWRGGDVAHTVGGGQKVRWLKEAMGKLRHRQDLVVMFVDSYDVVFAGGPREVLRRFWGAGLGVLFSAEAFCWPQEGLAPRYPPCPPGGKPFLNSGGFLGFAPAVWRLVERWNLPDDADDQLYYTLLYLDPHLREELGLALDHFSQIFQNLNGALDEVVLKFEPGRVRVRNAAYDTSPLIIHGNGPTKLQLNYLGNYIPTGWSYEGGCGDCDLDLRPLQGVPDEELPWVLVGVFVEQPTPFLPLFFQRLLSLDYPRARLHLFLHNGEPLHEPQVSAVWPLLTQRFGSVRRATPQEGLGEGEARELGMSLCRGDPRCHHYLSIDADVAVTNPGTLRLLLRQNRLLLAPLLSRPGQLWSNFWGALSPEGFYARAQDYVEIVQGKRRGVWNVPFVSGLYLVGGAALRGPLGEGPLYTHPHPDPHPDPPMAFCHVARKRGLFLHVTNREEFGHLLDPSGIDPTRGHPELWEGPRNPLDWEQWYLHPNHSRMLEEKLYQEPCPQVLLLPLFSERFCGDLLEELGGNWSQDQWEPSALSVPLSGSGLELPWVQALGRALRTLTPDLCPGCGPGLRVVQSRVLRYRPAPHPEATPTTATPPTEPPMGTLRLSLELGPSRGGGWLFPHRSCRVPAPPPGWALLHPEDPTERPRTLTPTQPRHLLISGLTP